MRKNYIAFRWLLMRVGKREGLRTYKQQAEYLHVSESQMSTWYNGVMPNGHNLMYLADVTGLPFDELISPDSNALYYARHGYDGLPPHGASL